MVASPRRFVALGNQWESSDADAVRLDQDDAPVLQRLSELGQVVLEERRLVGWPVLVAVSEQDQRRRGFLAGCQERAEIGVRETMTRFSVRARSKISSSDAACIPSSRTWSAS